MLHIEITETAIVAARERAIALLQQLRALGVRLALDDFGTGYSSLSYLKSFPIDTLKIDRSFVAEMLTDHTTASIIEAIISMTRILGLSVIAEGVEDHAQLAFLKQIGCDAVQGLLFQQRDSGGRVREAAGDVRRRRVAARPMHAAKRHGRLDELILGRAHD